MSVYHEVRNFCWSLYYELNPPDTFVEGPQKNLPDDIFLKHIFPLLNCCEVVHNISLVNRKWKKLSDDEELLKYLIYKDIVFKPSDWQKHLGLDLGFAENQKAWNALPTSIGKILKSSPHVKLKIVWMPKDTSINNFGQLLKKAIRKTDDYYLMNQNIRKELGDVPLKESGFVVMQLQSKPYEPYEWVCGDVFDLKMSYNQYRKPTILESIVCISAVYFKTRSDQFSYIYNNHCQVNGVQIRVSLKILNEGYYLEGISVELDSEIVKTSKKAYSSSRGRPGLLGL